MKRYYLLLVIVLFNIAISCAQTSTPKTATSAQAKNMANMLNEKSVVKDSADRVLPYEQWHELAISGSYGLIRNSTDPANHFKLYRLSRKQREANQKRMEQMKAEIQQKMAEANANQPPNPVSVSVERNTITAIPMPRESGVFKNGEKIEPIRMTDMQGNSLNMKKMAGKVIVLNFWFIGCPPCREEIPQLNKIVDEYANNKDVVFIAIALDKRYEIKKFLEEIPYKYQIVDDGRYFANGYGVNLYPTNVVIDKTGIIKFNSVGFGPSVTHWLKKTIDESLVANQIN